MLSQKRKAEEWKDETIIMKRNKPDCNNSTKEEPFYGFSPRQIKAPVSGDVRKKMRFINLSKESHKQHMLELSSSLTIKNQLKKINCSSERMQLSMIPKVILSRLEITNCMLDTNGVQNVRSTRFEDRSSSASKTLKETTATVGFNTTACQKIDTGTQTDKTKDDEDQNTYQKMGKILEITPEAQVTLKVETQIDKADFSQQTETNATFDMPCCQVLCSCSSSQPNDASEQVIQKLTKTISVLQAALLEANLKLFAKKDAILIHEIQDMEKYCKMPVDKSSDATATTATTEFVSRPLYRPTALPQSSIMVPKPVASISVDNVPLPEVLHQRQTPPITPTTTTVINAVSPPFGKPFKLEMRRNSNMPQQTIFTQPNSVSYTTPFSHAFPSNFLREQLQSTSTLQPINVRRMTMIAPTSFSQDTTPSQAIIPHHLMPRQPQRLTTYASTPNTVAPNRSNNLTTPLNNLVRPPTDDTSPTVSLSQSDTFSQPMIRHQLVPSYGQRLNIYPSPSTASTSDQIQQSMQLNNSAYQQPALYIQQGLSHQSSTVPLTNPRNFQYPQYLQLQQHQRQPQIQQHPTAQQQHPTAQQQLRQLHSPVQQYLSQSNPPVQQHLPQPQPPVQQRLPEPQHQLQPLSQWQSTQMQQWRRVLSYQHQIRPNVPSEQPRQTNIVHPQMQQHFNSLPSHQITNILHHLPEQQVQFQPHTTLTNQIRPNMIPATRPDSMQQPDQQQLRQYPLHSLQPQQSTQSWSNRLHSRSHTEFIPKEQILEERLQRYRLQKQREEILQTEEIREGLTTFRKEEAFNKEEARQNKEALKKDAAIKRKNAQLLKEENSQAAMNNGKALQNEIHRLRRQEEEHDVKRREAERQEANNRQEAERREIERQNVERQVVERKNAQRQSVEEKREKAEKPEQQRVQRQQDQLSVPAICFYCLICHEEASLICETCHNISCCSGNCYEHLRMSHEQSCSVPQMKIISKIVSND